METLRIAHVDLIPKLNGGHVAIANIVKALANKGHEVHLVRGTSEKNERDSEEVDKSTGARFFIHYVVGPKTVLNMPRAFKTAARKLEDFDSKTRFDIINAHAAGAFAVMLSRQKDIESRLIVTLHGHQLYRALMLASDLVRFRQSLLQVGFVENVAVNFSGAFLYFGLEVMASRRAVYTTVPSEFDRTLMLRMHLVDEERIVAVPNCIETHSGFSSREQAKEELKLASSQVILFSGPLIPLKGVHYLLKAMKQVNKKVPSAKLVLAGEGMLQSQALKRDSPSSDEKVICLGWVPHEMMHKFYAAADLLAHPSLYESCSLTIAEALSLGVPVVAFNTAAIPEYISDGKTGLLAELGNSDDLAKKMINILQDENLAEKLGKNGKEFASNMFSPKAVAGKMEEVYKHVK